MKWYTSIELRDAVMIYCHNLLNAWSLCLCQALNLSLICECHYGRLGILHQDFVEKRGNRSISKQNFVFRSVIGQSWFGKKKNDVWWISPSWGVKSSLRQKNDMKFKWSKIFHVWWVIRVAALNAIIFQFKRLFFCAGYLEQVNLNFSPPSTNIIIVIDRIAEWRSILKLLYSTDILCSHNHITIVSSVAVGAGLFLFDLMHHIFVLPTLALTKRVIAELAFCSLLHIHHVNQSSWNPRSYNPYHKVTNLPFILVVCPNIGFLIEIIMVTKLVVDVAMISIFWNL